MAPTKEIAPRRVVEGGRRQREEGAMAVLGGGFVRMGWDGWDGGDGTFLLDLVPHGLDLAFLRRGGGGVEAADLVGFFEGEDG